MPDLLRDDGGAPAKNEGVLRALKAINPHLYVAWKNFRFDPNTGRYLIYARGRDVGQPVPWPNGGGRWCVFTKNDAGIHFLFAHMAMPAGEFLPLDDRICERLLLDAARFMSPEEIMSLREDSQIRHRDKLRAVMDDIYWENIKRNRRKGEEALAIDPNTTRWTCKECGYDGPPTVGVLYGVPTPACTKCGSTDMTDMPVRDAKIFSYPGQENRATRLRSVEKTAEEDGWEIVDVQQEMKRARDEV
jgi:predicted Zn-ribbon and HTH transcriptional regulator